MYAKWHMRPIGIRSVMEIRALRNKYISTFRIFRRQFNVSMSKMRKVLQRSRGIIEFTSKEECLTGTTCISLHDISNRKRTRWPNWNWQQPTTFDLNHSMSYRSCGNCHGNNFVAFCIAICSSGNSLIFDK